MQNSSGSLKITEKLPPGEPFSYLVVTTSILLLLCTSFAFCLRREQSRRGQLQCKQNGSNLIHLLWSSFLLLISDIILSSSIALCGDPNLSLLFTLLCTWISFLAAMMVVVVMVVMVVVVMVVMMMISKLPAQNKNTNVIVC